MAVLMVLGGGVASWGAQAPLRLEVTQSISRTRETPHSKGTVARGNSKEAASHSPHFLTVKFDYNFAKTPACSAKVKTACVEKFIAYDISDGLKHRVKLFEIKLPDKPVGFVPGIRQKSPDKLDFESGMHLIAVVASEPDGRESLGGVCTTWIDIR